MISVVMPVYNAIDTLDEAFQSVLRSGVADQEIVLVDDGSTDGSWDAIQRYQAVHANVVALRHDRNRGGGAARNTGVRAASHDLIFVLDSDDVLIDDALAKASDAMADGDLDGAATGRSTFFVDDIARPTHSIEYRRGAASFVDLVSHVPSPVTGNLLFRRSAFETAGGYPEHHGFDTQAFGFRLLGNNLNIRVLNQQLYLQRLPRRPSYYVREARQGNINRNWFYIFVEHLYKFRPEVRTLLLTHDYAEPMALAKEENVFKIMTDISASENIFNSEGLQLNDLVAYEAYKQSGDRTLQAWCALMDLRRNDVKGCLERLGAIEDFPAARRVLYPLLATWSSSQMQRETIREIQYFFGVEKPVIWWAKHSFQRVLNKLSRLVR